MKKTFSNIRNLPWLPICLIILIIIFFSIRLAITYDSAHYLNYVAIFESNLPASSWDIVRGPVFPAIIFLFDTLFGKTGTGILVGTFIFYLIFAVTCYQTCKSLCQNLKHQKLIQNILLAVLILNPLILGYFHVLLTEFVAITLTMLNILLAYKWLSCDTHKKSHLIIYALYFILSIIFCYHLKQSYIIIAAIPPLTAAIISIVRKHTLKNILYRTGTLLAAFLLLIISIFSWNKILTSIGADMNTGRDSSSLLSVQLLHAYQIPYDQNTTEPLSTVDAVGILFNNFVTDPFRILSIYASNYCGLTSVCIIESNDGVDYISTFQFAGIDTYENSIIPYRAYSTSSNIFDMPDNLHGHAAIYGDSHNRSLVALFMNIFKIPTNLLFKLSVTLCFPFLIFLIVIKLKFKNRRYSYLFSFDLILLTTAFLHLALSASVGLIIDRYAVEAFVPSTLGIFGTIAYAKFVITKTSAKSTITSRTKPAKSTKQKVKS